MARARALVAGRLVQHEQRTLVVRPRRAGDAEDQVLGAHFGVRVVDHGAVDADGARATSAAHSRRVPKPWVKSACAIRTRSVMQLEQDDVVVGHRPGAADDALGWPLNSPTTGRPTPSRSFAFAVDTPATPLGMPAGGLVPSSDDAIARHAEVAARPRQRDHRAGVAVGVGEALGAQAARSATSAETASGRCASSRSRARR